MQNVINYSLIGCDSVQYQGTGSNTVCAAAKYAYTFLLLLPKYPAICICEYSRGNPDVFVASCQVI